MATSAPPPASAPVGAGSERGGELHRSVGFYGLMFVSLGSIIGSGWLLGALNAAKAAGPASILSWILAAAMLTLLALVYAELGATYPVAGGSGRFPYFSHGPIAGFLAGWSSWLQAVAIAPIEIEAALTYLDSWHPITQHFPMIYGTGSKAGLLNGRGLIVAIILMLLFTALNLAGAKFMSESNSIVVIWKTFVPVLAIVVVAGASFHGGNFHAGGGFAPYGVHGIFAALPAGVVFALQGFEQAVQLAGEARNPKKDLSRSIITAMAIGAVLYTLLQVAFIAGVEPAHVAKDWTNPLGGSGAGDYGAWYTLALAVGAGWLGTILLIDAIVSPSGTGIVYAGTTARLSYALGEEKEMPSALASTNSRGVPAVSLVVGCIVGIACFGPFRGWSTLVGVVTAFTAIMYGFAPVALAALHKADPDRPRTYHAPAPAILLPASFVSANLVIYWGGYNYTWKLAVAMGVGLVLFAVGSSVAKTDMFGYIKNAVWVGAWLIGDVIIGLAGRYGDGSKNWLPEWIDLLVVVVFSLGIFYWAANSALRLDQVQQEIAKSAHQMEAEAKLVTS